MLDGRISYRYASALFDLSKRNKISSEVAADVKSFLDVCKENRDFLLFLKNPVVKKNVKRSVINKVFAGFFKQDTMTFINMVLNNERETFLPDIFNRFLKIYKESKSIVSVEVITAVELSSQMREIMTSYIKGISKYNEVELNNIVDKSIYGGFKIKYNDMLLDASIAYQLSEMKKKFIK